jgi:adenylate kinase
MIGVVRSRLGRPDAAAGFILDGFPRTVAQATALDVIMNGRDPLIVLDMVVPETELVRRLSTRLICANCGHNAPLGHAEPGDHCEICGGELVQRTDDSQAVVIERLKVYRTSTAPLVDFYRVRPTFRSINGAQAPDLVAAELAAAIGALSNGGGPHR